MTQATDTDTTGNKLVLDAIEKLDGKIEKLEIDLLPPLIGVPI